MNLEKMGKKFIFLYNPLKDKSAYGQMSLNICELGQDYLEEEVTQCLGREEIKDFTNRSAKRKNEIFWSRLMAKQAIGDLAGSQMRPFNEIEITKGFLKNPIIKGVCSGTQISIAHCKEYAGAVAYPEELIIGMDMEVAGYNKDNSIWQILADRERKMHPENMDRERFSLIMWTAKEALVKFMKLGLTVSFEIMQIDSIACHENGYRLKFRYFHGLEAYCLLYKNLVCTLVYPMELGVTQKEEAETYGTYDL